uniref:Sut2 n=1 Tax=Arundo donax TaxID=35708 RepID=A0A0A9D7G2_ARUDO
MCKDYLILPRYLMVREMMVMHRMNQIMKGCLMVMRMETMSQLTQPPRIL